MILPLLTFQFAYFNLLNAEQITRRCRCCNDPDTRDSASSSLRSLTAAVAHLPLPAHVTQLQRDDVQLQQQLRCLNAFIEPFCASSGMEVYCSLMSATTVSLSRQMKPTLFQLQSVDVHQQKSWIFQLVPQPADDLFPLHFARPQRQGEEANYGFFLPRNIAQQLQCDDPAGFDVTRLQFLSQGSQYTSFRYVPLKGPSSIIKRACVDTSTLKYMLREKAMCQYLQHDNIVKMLQCFSPTALLLDAGSSQEMSRGKFNDTYIV